MYTFRLPGLAESIVTLALCAACAGPAIAEITFRQIEMTDGSRSYTFDYAVAAPDDLDPAERYALLVLLPSGDQAIQDVGRTIEKFEKEANKRHWIVVSPAAWEGVSLHEGTHALVPPLVEHVRSRYPIDDDAPVYLAGGGSGGQSAIEIAAYYPDLADGVVVFPGIPYHSRSAARLEDATHMTFDFFAGGRDTAWNERREQFEERLLENGVRSSVRVFPDAGHDLSSMSTVVIMDKLDSRRGDFPQPSDEALRASQALTALHTAAATADEQTYFSLFAPEAIFLGTDAGERWTIEQFRDFAAPHFRGDSAWTYTPLKRAIFIDETGDAAWFDETLSNERLGLCRGTGALRKIDGDWRITQYNLTLPIPNELADDVVKQIRAGEETPMLPTP